MDGAPPRAPSEQLAQHETLQHKPDRSLANKTGQIEKLTTEKSSLVKSSLVRQSEKFRFCGSRCGPRPEFELWLTASGSQNKSLSFCLTLAHKSESRSEAKKELQIKRVADQTSQRRGTDTKCSAIIIMRSCDP